MGLLSGLEKFGFRSLDEVQVYEEEKKKEDDNNGKKRLLDLTEPEMLFEKTYICPVCENEMKIKTLKQGKAKLMGTDVDLRAVYMNIDPMKYGAILCRKCGYAALTNYFKQLSDAQVRLIKQNITSKYNPGVYVERDMYTYDEALEIHKMALLNAVVKRSKTSEKAYICLKTAWLYRGKAELRKQENAPVEEIEELNKMEKDCIKNAYEGFTSAIETESSQTICGMDSPTVSYLCAALAYELGEYEEALRTMSRIYMMPGVNRRTKDKCAELKELIIEKRKIQD